MATSRLGRSLAASGGRRTRSAWWAGLIGLALSGRQKLRGALLGLGATLLALLAGFITVGLLRHDWTSQTNAQLHALEQGEAGATPGLLDAWFVTPFSIAAALGAVTLIAVYVIGERGRNQRREIAEIKLAQQQAERELEAVKLEVEEVHAQVEGADAAINEVRADAEAAKIAEQVIRETWNAERHTEDALTAAAIGAHEFRYRVTDRRYDHGNCVYAQLPDTVRLGWSFPRPPQTITPSHGNGGGRMTQHDLNQLIKDD